MSFKVIVRLCLLKFGFSEKATKFEENLCPTFDKSIWFCARNSVLVKKWTKIFQNKFGQVVLYKLYLSTPEHLSKPLIKSP